MTLATTRRGLLKIAAIAGSAFAFPASAQVPFKEWKTQWTLGEIGRKTDIIKASVVPVVCPYCSIGCSIDMYVVGDKIVHITGSQDSFINKGALCPKGKAAFQVVDNELRLKKPMIRTGPKPPPEELLRAKSWDELVAIAKKYPPNWREVSWTEALQYIAERLGEILSRWRQNTRAPVQKDGYYYVGKDVPVQVIGSSILVNEESYLIRKFAAFIGTSNMDAQYRKCHSSTVAALAVTYGWGAETATLEDLALADVVLFFSSPAEAHPVSLAHFLKGKRERGTIFITFDPRYSRTAAISDIWVPFRSGTETAILHYILHYAFFERNPPIDQLPEFRRLMSRWNITDDDLADLKELLKDYTADEVSKISGVSVDLLRTVAQIYVENSGVVTNHKKHGVIQWAMGVTQHTNATINIIRAIAIVQLLLGNVGYPGGGAHPFRGHSNVQGTTDMHGGGWDALPGYHGNPTSPFEVRLYQDWKLQGMPDAWSWEVPQWARNGFATTAPDRGKADLVKVLQVYKFYGWRRLELAWGLFCGTKPEEDPVNGVVICDFPFGAGSSEITFVRRALAGEIKAAFIFGENPAVTNPNTKLVWAALSSLELLVVTDIFQSETAWFADVVLPAASFAEKEGTRTNTSGVIQWTYRAVSPRGDSRPDYWIVAKIYEYLRQYGVIKLPSEVAGVKTEKVTFRRGGKLIFIYERSLKPDESWNYAGGLGRSAPVSPIEAEVNPRIINKEINFAVLLYQGIYDPIRDEFTTMRRSTRLREEGEIDGVFSKKFMVYKDWGWSWPMNVRFRYNYDVLKVMLGTEVKVKAAGREYVVTGETGEWIDEYTGEYRPAFLPGHNFWIPRSFKRKLSGVADLFGGLDVVTYIRTGEVKIDGKFVVEEGGEVKTLSFEEYVAKTGMKYLWVNDTLYWDEETTSFKAAVKRPFFSGGGWRAFKPKMEQMRELLRKYYQESGSLKTAVLKAIGDMGGWYAGYNFQWPIHTEPVESPDIELAIRYPTLAWLNPYNISVLKEEPDIVRGKPVGVALEPKDLESLPGELVVITSNRLTEHFHSGTMTRNSPMLAELVPEPFVYVPRAIAQKLGIASGDYVDIITARGSIRLKAYVTEGMAYLNINGKKIPVVSVVWTFGFLGYIGGAVANFIVPDVGDVVTTIQESKAWLGKIKKAEMV